MSFKQKSLYAFFVLSLACRKQDPIPSPVGPRTTVNQNPSVNSTSPGDPSSSNTQPGNPQPVNAQPGKSSTVSAQAASSQVKNESPPSSNSDSSEAAGSVRVQASSAQPWLQRALAAQSVLDAEAPLGRALFLGTHNSFNSRAYAGLGRYLDPNQEISILDQLRSGARSIELDVHSGLGDALILCHARRNHVGCSPADRPFQSGLEEVATWLAETASRPEVLMVYVEDMIDGADGHRRAAQLISQHLEPHIYKPSSGTCQGIPTDVTKSEIIRSGKRVILITDGCVDNEFQKVIFGGVAENHQGYPTDSQKTYDTPQCKSKVFIDAAFDRFIVRFFEDRTMLSRTIGSGDGPITPQLVQDLLSCGANVFGLDFLVADDERIKRSIWSWANNEPDNTGGVEHCARVTPEARLADSRCDAVFRFACRDVSSAQWFVSAGSGTWSQGSDVCKREGSRNFLSPYSSRDLFLLQEAKKSAGASDVWVNFTDETSEGSWRVVK